MSKTSSESNSDTSLVSENQEDQVESNLPEKPSSEVEDDENYVIATPSSPQEFSPKLSLGELKATDDMDEDDEGFKTPTSLESKIPMPTQCPLAPVPKRRLLMTTSPTTRKRKASSYFFRRFLELVGEDLESLFPESPDDLSGSYKKIKRPPKDQQ